MADVAAAVRLAARAGGQAGGGRLLPLVCGGLRSPLNESAKDRHRSNGPMMLAESAGEPHSPASPASPCVVLCTALAAFAAVGHVAAVSLTA
jgi:hypothetical protein